MATEITPSPIWSYGNSTVDNLGDARTFAHESAYELSNGTLAFTVTADSVAGRQGLFSKDSEYFGDGGHFTVWIEDGKILARLQSQDQSYELTGGTVIAGEPLSIAVSFGSDGFKLFVDGELVDRSGYTGGLEGNKEPIVIGASQWASSEQKAGQLTHEFKGTISDVALYDEILSAEAIRDLDTPTEDSTIAPIWSHGDAVVDNLRDAQTFAHESAYELSNGTLAFTVTADSVAGRQGLFSKDSEYFGDGGHFTVWIEDGKILARLQSQDQSYELTGGTVTAGEPLSIAVSFGSGGFELFVDGELVDRSDYTGGLEGNKEPIVIGASQWASSEQKAAQLTHEFKGTISDVALYDEILSAEAIQDLADPSSEPGEPSDPPPANSAPTLVEALDTLVVDEGEQRVISLDGLFSDPDGDELTMMLRGNAPFASIDADNNLVINPVDGDDGTYTFRVSATDTAGNTTSFATQLTIDDALGGSGPDEEPTPTPEPEPVNSAPVITGSAVELSVTERDTGRVDLSNLFQDPDGDELNLSLKGAPGFVSINANDRLVATPQDGDDGNYSFSVVASDGEKNSPGLEVTLVVDDYVEEPPAGGGNDGGSYVPEAVTLTADLGIVTAGVKGPQEWGKGVTLNGYDLNGNQAEVFTSDRWDDVGFGVKGPGSRWDDQIDYYASGGGRSEKMVVDFNGDVTDVVMRIGMLGATEGPGNTPETGTWKAYDSSGKMVDQGLIGPDYSALGKGVKESQSYGLFPIKIDTTAAIERLELEATQFNYGNGSSTTMDYGENSSDYNLVGLEFLRTEPVDEFLF